MEKIDFAVFILTHGRANNVITTKTLKKQGYTGKIFYIVDNEDASIMEYKKRFGEDVHVFNKKEYADKIDEGNNFDERRTITHARNACFDIAKKLGITYFLQLDDDYQFFEYRFTKGMFKIKSLDVTFSVMVQFYMALPDNVKSIALAQGGDFIGGVQNQNFKNATLKRKCMNSFFCSTLRPFQFVGAMNEDVNTYTTLGSRGNLFFTVPLVSLSQKATQTQEGGITDMYLLYGTYCKAFTTVMMHPSGVKVSTMGDKHKRIHHKINWRYTVPKIVSERIVKTAQ